MNQIQKSIQLWRELWVTTKYLQKGIAKPKELLAIAAICPIIHIAIVHATHPQNSEAYEATRTLSATAQWGIMLITTTLMGLNSTRWQLEENYASDLLTCTTPRRWLNANMLGVWLCSLAQLAGHLATMTADLIYRHQMNTVPAFHWLAYASNSAITLLTVAAISTLFSLYVTKSAGFVLLVLILAAWINYIPEPWTYVLPPIYALDAKGLLVAAGNSASYTMKPLAWIGTILAGLVYAIAMINLTTDRLILKKLRT